MNENTPVNKNTAETSSYFDGDATTNISISLFSGILRLGSLGFASPAVLCLKKRWQIEHTHLSGRRLVFDGNPAKLILKNALWVLFSFFTLGIFLPFKSFKLLKWECANTHFIGYDGEDKSKFTGSLFGYIGVHLAAFFATVLSLGVAYAWAYGFKERWLTEHKIVDGRALRYDGTGKTFLLRQLKWAFFIIITLGIFALFLKGRLLRYSISHTGVDDPRTIPYNKELAARQAILHAANKYALLSFIFSVPSAVFLLCAALTVNLGSNIGESAVAVVPYVLLALAAASVAAALILAVKGYRGAASLNGNGKVLSVIMIIVYCCAAVGCSAVLIKLLCLI